MSDAAFIAKLLDGPHTFWCSRGHENVTWEKPPPAVGHLRRCAGYWLCEGATLDGRSVVARVEPGLPLARVRQCLGAKVAAAVLAAGGSALMSPSSSGQRPSDGSET